MTIKDEKLKPYFIKSDGMNYEVVRETSWTSGTGNSVTKNMGNFSSVTGALRKIAKLKVEGKDSEYTVKGYIEELERVSNEIIKID